MTEFDLIRFMELQRQHPALEAHDWRVLAAVCAGQGRTSTADLRHDAAFFGTANRIRPALDRLKAAGLIADTVTPGHPTTWSRTAKPLTPAPTERLL